MKLKFLFLLLLLSSFSVYAQNENIPNPKKSSMNIDNEEHDDILQARRSIIINTIQTFKDSLVAADTSYHDFGNESLFGEINIYNAGADADTNIIEYWDIFNNRYTSDMNGLTNNKTGIPESDNTLIIIPAGKSYRYTIKEPYPGKVRIRTKFTTGQGADKIYIGYIGKN